MVISAFCRIWAAQQTLTNTHTRTHLPGPTSGLNVVHLDPFLLMLNPSSDYIPKLAPRTIKREKAKNGFTSHCQSISAPADHKKAVTHEMAEIRRSILWEFVFEACFRGEVKMEWCQRKGDEGRARKSCLSAAMACLCLPCEAYYNTEAWCSCVCIHKYALVFMRVTLRLT